MKIKQQLDFYEKNSEIFCIAQTYLSGSTLLL